MTLSDATEQGQSDPFILLHPEDNVLICTAAIMSGTSITIDGQRHVVTTTIELGHKIARTDLDVGDKVIRYGLPIGTIQQQVRAGNHVHSHNLESDYLAATDRVAIHNRTDGQ